MNDAFGPQPDDQQETPPPVGAPVRRRARHHGRLYHPPRRRRVWPLVMVCLLTAVAGVGYQVWTRYVVLPTVIYLNDTPIVTVANDAVAARAMQRVRARHQKDAPELVTFQEGMVEIRRANAPGGVRSLDDAVNALDARLTAVFTGFAIFVDGAPLVMLRSESEAITTLSRLLEKGRDGKPGLPTFRERVVIARMEIVEGDDRDLPLVTPDEAVPLLVHPPKPNYHTVERGDSFWVISNKHGLSVLQVKALNPKLDTRRLDVGDKVRLPDKESPVTVVVREQNR